jgi:hypothetical protein
MNGRREYKGNPLRDGISIRGNTPYVRRNSKPKLFRIHDGFVSSKKIDLELLKRRMKFEIGYDIDFTEAELSRGVLRTPANDIVDPI